MSVESNFDKTTTRGSKSQSWVRPEVLSGPAGSVTRIRTGRRGDGGRCQRLHDRLTADERMYRVHGCVYRKEKAE